MHLCSCLSLYSALTPISCMPNTNLNQNIANSNQGGGHSQHITLDTINQSIEDNVSHMSQTKNAMQTFEERIALQGWQLRGKTAADGNCCFHAVCCQLRKLDPDQQVDHISLRNNVVQFIRNLPQDRKQEITYFLTEPLDVYLQKLSIDGTYADHVCLHAFCDMLSADILVVHGQGDNVKLLPKHTTSGKTLVPEIQHYVSLDAFNRFQTEDFVAVILSNKRRKQLFIAKVFSVEDNDVQLKFMRPTATEGVYTWPNKDDISWQPMSDVLRKLSVPDLQLGRGIKLKFNLSEINECKQLCL